METRGKGGGLAAEAVETHEAKAVSHLGVKGLDGTLDVLDLRPAGRRTVSQRSGDCSSGGTKVG